MFVVINDEAYNFTLMEQIFLTEDLLTIKFGSGQSKDIKFKSHLEATKVFDLIMAQASCVEYTNLVEFIETKTTSAKGRKKK